MPHPNKLGHFVVLVVGVFACVLVSRDLRTHAVELVSHLRSGNWEVMTDRSTVEKIVRNKYADSSTWAVSFLATTGQSFALHAAERRETIRSLGRQSIADSPNLRFNSAPLQHDYGAFLAQALLELALPAKREDANLLRRYAEDLINTSGSVRTLSDPELYSRAQDVLANLPKTSLLKKALSDYDEFGRGRSLDFPAYEVGTLPSDDAPGAWDVSAQTLPQLGKCKAKVSSFANSGQEIDANVALLPRLLEVGFDRRWISNALLDEVFERRGPFTARYFHASGHLRLIPERLWILLPEDASIAPDTDDDRKQIVSWGRDNTCCRIVCNGEIFDFSPTSFREHKDETYTLRRSDRSPLLYAIVSRRRAPK